MGAVDTDSPKVQYLSTQVERTDKKDKDGNNVYEPRIECYNNGVKTLHKAWKGYIIGFRYRSTEQGAQFGTELHVLLGEGSQVYDLGMVLKAGTARGFMRAMENLDLRRPTTFRPWSYQDENVKDPAKRTKIGGFNLEQGGRQIAYKYLDTSDGHGDMPLPETIDNGDGTSDRNFGKQITFLRGILDTKIAPAVQEIVEMGAFLPEDAAAIRQIAPTLEPLQLAEKTDAADLPATDIQGGPPAEDEPADVPGEGEFDDLPFDTKP